MIPGGYHPYDRTRRRREATSGGAFRGGARPQEIGSLAWTAGHAGSQQHHVSQHTSASSGRGSGFFPERCVGSSSPPASWLPPCVLAILNHQDSGSAVSAFRTFSQRDRNLSSCTPRRPRPARCGHRASQRIMPPVNNPRTVQTVRFVNPDPNIGEAAAETSRWSR